MLRRINELLGGNESFAFETTLSTRSYKNTIIDAKRLGYTVTLLYFWLQNIELAKERVSIRVSEGGHNIESEIIEIRYIRGMKNLFDIYLPVMDGALIIDNSREIFSLIARKPIGDDVRLIDEKKFQDLKRYYDYR